MSSLNDNTNNSISSSVQQSKTNNQNTTLPKELASLFVDKDHYKYLSKPLTKEQLREAKKLIDNKINLNNSLPKVQAYLDKEGNLKVAKVTRYIPTNLILTKDGQLVLKNPQQQVDYMNFIGEPLDTDSNNRKANKINKLMQKVNNLSVSMNHSNNPFAANASSEDVTMKTKNNNNSTYVQLENGTNPFLSPKGSFPDLRENKTFQSDFPKSSSTQVESLNNCNHNSKSFEQLQSQQVLVNSITSMRTKSSAESVISSTFIENNFPQFPSLNSPDYHTPKQNLSHITSNDKQPKSAGNSKSLFSSLNKKLKTTNIGGSSSTKNGLVSPNSTGRNETEIPDLKSYEGLLPWENHIELMQWIDPVPAYPPSYNKCNPTTVSDGLHFPIYEEAHNPLITAPPDYKPGIEGITIVAMKVEFLSPFDKAMFRHWKYYIFELNSTQINFYHLDAELTNDLPKFKDGKDDSCQIREKEKNNDFSSYTEQYQIIQGKKIWVNGSDAENSNKTAGTNTKILSEEYVMSKLESRQILQKVMNNPARYLTNNKLCKSFSLQNNDFGIATDCNERPYILRLRCEMEQFLLSFSNVMDMINWSVYLSVGIGISLDLEERCYPSYRIVPIGSSRNRRRRRRRLREERRHMLLLEQQEQLNLYNQQNLKKQQNTLQQKGSILNFSRLRTSSGSSLSHNGTIGANMDAIEKRRSSLANINDFLLEDESSSLVELCSTIEAERRRRMSNNQSINSFDSLSNAAVTGLSSDMRNDSESAALVDEEDDEEDEEEEVADDVDDEIDARIVNSNEIAASNFPMIDDNVRLIERENRRLMEEYTSLTIKRVLREDENEELSRQSSAIDSESPLIENVLPEDVDRSNPALVLTHALTNIQFAPSKKKNTALPEINNKNSRDELKRSANSVKETISHHSVLNILGSSNENDSNKGSKKLISKLFGRKSSNSNKAKKVHSKESPLPTRVKKNGSSITVDSLITSAPTERRQSLVASKREPKPSVSPPISTSNASKTVLLSSSSQAAETIESNILAEEREIMEEELQLENFAGEEDDQEGKETSTAAEDLENEENRMNTYEREGLQFEEVGDYIYCPQKPITLHEKVTKVRSYSNKLDTSPTRSSHNALREVFTNESIRRRSASIHSQISHSAINIASPSPQTQEKYVWAPSRKIMTKKKYIREAIGCVKPLLENETWHGKVISTPCLAPVYDTNNPPISGILEELGKVDANSAKNASLFKYGFSQHDTKKQPKFKLILRRCKNHYLKQSVVGPSGYVRL